MREKTPAETIKEAREGLEDAIEKQNEALDNIINHLNDYLDEQTT